MRPSRLISRLVSFGRIALVCVLATLGVAAPASAKTFGSTVVALIDRIDIFDTELGAIVTTPAKMQYYADHLPALVDEVDALGKAAERKSASDPEDRQAAIVRRIGAAAQDYAVEGQAMLTVISTGNEGLFEAGVQRMTPSTTELRHALAAYGVPYTDLLIDDPYWKVPAAVGAVLASLFALHTLGWLFGRRSTLAQRERRRARLRLAGRAVLASVINAAGPQLYRTPGAATSTGVRVAMVGTSAAAFAFLMSGEVQQLVARRRRKRSQPVHVGDGPRTATMPNWAPHESSVTQHAVPVGDIAPLPAPNDGVLLLGDFLRTGDEEPPTWHGDHDLVGAVSTPSSHPAPPVAPRPPRPVDAPAAPSFAPAMASTRRPPPPPAGQDAGPVRMAVPSVVRTPPPPPPPPAPMHAAAPATGMPPPAPATPGAAMPPPAPLAAPAADVAPPGTPPPPPPLPRRRPRPTED